MADSSPFVVAEKASGDLGSLALIRWALVVVFVWIAGMKFSAYGADGIGPMIENSPFMSWLPSLVGVRGAARVLAVPELITGAVLVAGAFNGVASALGAAMSSMTFIVTLSFLVTTPGVFEPSAGGFPVFSGFPGLFLLKDLVLLAAALCLLRASLSPAAISWPQSIRLWKRHIPSA